MLELGTRSFQDIPLTKEERAKRLEKGEPRLPGAPETAEDSIFASLNIEAFERVSQDTTQYQNTPQAKKRRMAQRERLRGLLNNSQAYTEYFDTLHLVEGLWDDRKENLEDYEKQFQENFDRYLREITKYNPDMLRQWLELAVHSNVYREQAEKIVRSKYEHCKTHEETIDFLYAFAQAVLLTEDKGAYELGMKALCWNTEMLKADSKGLRQYIEASVMDKDDLLQKQQEVDSVLYVFAKKVVPDDFAAYEKHLNDAVGDTRVEQLLASLKQRDQKRYDKLVAFLLRQDSDGIRSVSIKNDAKIEWPYTLMLHGGPLRKLLNERMAQEDESFVSLTLPIQGDAIFKEIDAGSLRETILYDFNSVSDSANEFADPDIIKSLFYLSPELDKEAMEKLANDVVELRREIMHDLTHSLSKRGDKMLIVDPGLRQLGFRSFIFEFGDPASRTKVTVEVGKAKLIVELNDDLVMEPLGDKGKFPVSFERRAFLEHSILSHLYELQCTDRVSPGSHESSRSHGDAVIRQKEFTSRRAHLRKLPPGKAFSKEALEAGLNDLRGFDLVRINSELGLTQATGQKTYVKEKDEVAIGRRDPVVSRAPKAMDRYRSLVQKVDPPENLPVEE